ncbi:Thioesterase-like protein [Collimonas arenae]|uniref:Thioesterase-like protein n=1 Tax=Collimonas arenae TaxID=279058 RepID=A0A0A1FEX9_9BURK|nr:thioesterase family protein [Collimonas arenae]AIY42330.1 Thioesterase-like protein [Collimonas arenae]
MADAEPIPSTSLQLYCDVVRPEWVDYNGHLRDAFYMLIFSFATDALMDYIGLDEAERQRSGSSLYTLESHINYLKEVKAGALVRVQTRLLAHDAKRLQIYHSMHLANAEEALAASEQMLLHVDMRGPAATPFADAVAQRLHGISAVLSQLPSPQYTSRQIRMK